MCGEWEQELRGAVGSGDGEHPQPDPDGFRVGEEEEHIARKVEVSDGGGNIWPAGVLGVRAVVERC